MEARTILQKNPNATWANKEVRKYFQMVVDGFVKFYQEHGKDKNRDSFIYIRVSLKKTLALLFQETMPESASVDLYTTTNGLNQLLEIIDEKKMGKEKNKEFKKASKYVSNLWKDFSNYCTNNIVIESQKRIAEKKRLKEEEKKKQLETEAARKIAENADPFITELTQRISKKNLNEEKDIEITIKNNGPIDLFNAVNEKEKTTQESPAQAFPYTYEDYAQAFLFSKEELKKQINTIGAPKPRNYSPISLLKHAYAYYPKAMCASTVLEILGLTVGGLEWLNKWSGGKVDQFLLEHTGFTSNMIVAVGAIGFGSIGGVVSLVKSSNCSTPSVSEETSSESDGDEQELDAVQNLKAVTVETEGEEEKQGLLDGYEENTEDNMEENIEIKRYRGPSL